MLRSSSCLLRSSLAAARPAAARTILNPLLLRTRAQILQQSNFSASAVAMAKDTLTEAIKDDHEEVRVSLLSLPSVLHLVSARRV